MSTFHAFDISPVPAPGPDAIAPEPFRGIYGMPMFLTLPTADLAASSQFWTRGLGFIELFTIPGRLVHLRRWAFQDVLLVPDGAADGAQADAAAPSVPGPVLPDGAGLCLSVVLGQLDEMVAACEELRPGCTRPPRMTPWNSREVEVATPEGLRLVLTAAVPLDPAGEQAQGLRDVGIDVP